MDISDKIKTYCTTELNNLYYSYYKIRPKDIQILPKSGSDRIYFRLFTLNESLIGTYSPDIDETNAFIYLTRHFNNKNLPVPRILNFNNNDVYLQSDVGNKSLFDYIVKKDDETKLHSFYKLALNSLFLVQFFGRDGIDYNNCFPRKKFDEISIKWDLNYFKYFFLKLERIKFHENRLQIDFDKLSNFAMQAETNFFLYRDFQSRNIMINNEDQISFIDYQGGREGALQYDIASFLYNSKSGLTENKRNELLEYYCSILNDHNINVERFKEFLPVYVLIRLLQTFGAYGYRGIFEQKSLFINSIPFAVSNLKQLKNSFIFLQQLPELNNVIEQIIEKYNND